MSSANLGSACTHAVSYKAPVNVIVNHLLRCLMLFLCLKSYVCICSNRESAVAQKHFLVLYLTSRVVEQLTTVKYVTGVEYM